MSRSGSTSPETTKKTVRFSNDIPGTTEIFESQEQNFQQFLGEQFNAICEKINEIFPHNADIRIFLERQAAKLLQLTHKELGESDLDKKRENVTNKKDKILELLNDKKFQQDILDTLKHVPPEIFGIEYDICAYYLLTTISINKTENGSLTFIKPGDKALKSDKLIQAKNIIESINSLNAERWKIYYFLDTRILDYISLQDPSSVAQTFFQEMKKNINYMNDCITALIENLYNKTNNDIKSLEPKENLNLIYFHLVGLLNQYKIENSIDKLIALSNYVKTLQQWLNEPSYENSIRYTLALYQFEKICNPPSEFLENQYTLIERKNLLSNQTHSSIQPINDLTKDSSKTPIQTELEKLNPYTIKRKLDTQLYIFQVNKILSYRNSSKRLTKKMFEKYIEASEKVKKNFPELANPDHGFNATERAFFTETLNQASETLNQASETLNQASETLNQATTTLNQARENVDKGLESLTQDIFWSSTQNDARTAAAESFIASYDTFKTDTSKPEYFTDLQSKINTLHEVNTTQRNWLKPTTKTGLAIFVGVGLVVSVALVASVYGAPLGFIGFGVTFSVASAALSVASVPAVAAAGAVACKQTIQEQTKESLLTQNLNSLDAAADNLHKNHLPLQAIKTKYEEVQGEIDTNKLIPIDNSNYAKPKSFLSSWCSWSSSSLSNICRNAGSCFGRSNYRRLQT